MIEVLKDHVYEGDALSILRSLPDESVDMCVTSPPYWGLRDYGTSPILWGGVPSCEHEWTDEVTERPNASGGHAGDRRNRKGVENFQEYVDYHNRQTTSGWCVKCGAWLGQLGLEPSPNLYVEHLVSIFHEVRRCLKKQGTLWLNIGDSYSGSGRGDGGPTRKQATNAGSFFESELQGIVPNGLKPKDLIGVPWMVAFALRADGWYLRSDIIWHKPNSMPESVRDRPTKAHEYLFLLTKSEHYYYDYEAVREPYTEPLNRWGGPSLKRDTGKTAAYKDMQHIGNSSAFRPGRSIRPNETGKNKRSVWSIPTKSFSGAHFATFPETLLETPIKAGCPIDGLVLDPFMGAGTTGVVAQRLGRHYVGAEMNPEYVKMANERITRGNKRLVDYD